MPASDIKILKLRSEEYREEADHLVSDKKWDLVLIAIRQHCELLLKYYAFKLNGTYPRTHSLRELIRLLVKHKPDLNTLVKEETTY